MFRTVLVVALASLALGVRPATADAPDPLDVESVARALRSLRVAERDGAPEPLAAYIERVGEHDLRDQHDAGFGGRRLRVTRRIDGLRATIRIAVHDGDVVATEIALHGSGDGWEQDRAAIAAAAAAPFDVERGAVHGAWESSAGMARWRARIGEALGVAEAAPVTEDLRGHVAVLVSPTRTYPVGATFGYAGITPEGRVAANALVAAEAWDALRTGLRSPNPEGRAEAARALVRAAAAGDVALTDADRKALRAIRSAPLEIETCRGCAVTRRAASAVVPALP